MLRTWASTLFLRQLKVASNLLEIIDTITAVRAGVLNAKTKDHLPMKKIFGLLICGILLGIALSLVSAEMIEHTSGDQFCSRCHSMKGVTAAWKEDPHGGNNKNGTKAKCADCHLPHDNVFHYVTAKAYTGVKDVYGELFKADTFDWVGNLEHRKAFTYSTGCQKCHDLEAIRYEIPKAYLAHKDFKTGKVTSCIHCHEHVGHKNIKAHL